VPIKTDVCGGPRWVIWGDITQACAGSEYWAYLSSWAWQCL